MSNKPLELRLTDAIPGYGIINYFDRNMYHKIGSPLREGFLVCYNLAFASIIIVDIANYF